MNAHGAHSNKGIITLMKKRRITRMLILSATLALLLYGLLMAHAIAGLSLGSFWSDSSSVLDLSLSNDVRIKSLHCPSLLVAGDEKEIVVTLENSSDKEQKAGVTAYYTSASSPDGTAEDLYRLKLQAHEVKTLRWQVNDTLMGANKRFFFRVLLGISELHPAHSARACMILPVRFIGLPLHALDGWLYLLLWLPLLLFVFNYMRLNDFDWQDGQTIIKLIVFALLLAGMTVLILCHAYMFALIVGLLIFISSIALIESKPFIPDKDIPKYAK